MIYAFVDGVSVQYHNATSYGQFGVSFATDGSVSISLIDSEGEYFTKGKE